jgi:5-methylcytosine-specific restriction endonuclease McrA
MTAAADKGALAFAEKLLGLLGEGRFTATYKYAVILGLMDLCLEKSTRTGSAPESVTTVQLADKIIELYWPHTLPFARGQVLEQNAGGQAAIVTKIDHFKQTHAGGRGATLHHARLTAPKAFDRLRHQVEWVLVKMPLPKLQRIGRGIDPFIYRIGWDDEVTQGQLGAAEFDNRIAFIGDAGDHLVRLAGLIRPLVQREWVSRVARLNDATKRYTQLEEFLFGASRSALAPVRDDLRQLQDGRCFYCDGRIQSAPQVDHFVPWARYPDDGLDNLVLAHGPCNNSKLDHLAAADHVARWALRAAAHEGDLAAIAAKRRWERHPERSLSVARAIYVGLPDDARLWQARGEFVELDRRALQRAL